jgi:tripartite-type tricarboxylate transporter receptor subunit TctC
MFATPAGADVGHYQTPGVAKLLYQHVMLGTPAVRRVLLQAKINTLFLEIKLKFLKHYLVAAVLLGASTFALAAETITVLWAFNIGSNQANTIRLIIDELNKTQDKYTFVIDNKPGAGGTIAANAVEAKPNTTLVGMSSSFIIRPYFEKNSPTHNLDNFTPVLVQGNGSPMTIVSGKYTKLENALANPNLTIGVSGIGSVSHLAANGLLQANKTASIVNFKSTVDAATAAAGGHVDVAVGFDADVAPFVDSGKVDMLGRTGPGTQLKQIPDADKLTANYAIFASAAMDPDRFREIHQLMVAINTKPAVVASYKRDLLTPVALGPEQSRTWYTSERAFWKRQVDKINGPSSRIATK